MSKLYCEPDEDMSVRSLFEPESNVHLQPKRRKATEKKTPLPKSVNIKVMFTSKSNVFFIAINRKRLCQTLSSVDSSVIILIFGCLVLLGLTE